MEHVTPERITQILQQVEGFFKTQEDPSQVPVLRESFDKLLHLDSKDIVIRVDEKGNLIGSMAVFPTTKTLADKFLNGKITEREMFDATEKMESPEALYLMSCIIDSEYRRQGYARDMAEEIAEYFLNKNGDIFLFTMPWTKEGLSFVKTVESVFGVSVHLPKKFKL